MIIPGETPILEQVSGLLIVISIPGKVMVVSLTTTPVGLSSLQGIHACSVI